MWWRIHQPERRRPRCRNGGGRRGERKRGNSPSSGGTAGTAAGESGSGGNYVFDGLIEGDPELCPPTVPTPQASCEVDELECTYANGLFGGSAYGPLACQCSTNANGEQTLVCWVPEQSDDDCPRELPFPPGCTIGMSCLYALSNTYAACTCIDEPPPEGGGEQGGAGGEAASAPETSWECAL